MSKRLAHKLVEVFREDYANLTASHLSEKFAADTADEDWIPELANDNSWIVITSDKGRDNKKRKLPLLCKQFKLSYVLVSSEIISSKYAFHKQTILGIWPQLTLIPKLPTGTKILLSCRKFRNGIVRWPFMTINDVLFDNWCKQNVEEFKN